MKNIKKIIDLVTIKYIGIDAWGDDLLCVAVEEVKKITDQGQIKKCIDIAKSLNETPGRRLIEAIINVHNPELFDTFIQMLNDADFESAEIIIDGLHSWPLDGSQKQTIKEASGKYYGKSKLLDIVIDTIK